MNSIPRGPWRAVFWAIVVVGGILALRAVWHFPWRATDAAIRNANVELLLLALVVNLVSLGAKGWAWHLLLQPVAPHRWRSAQEANLVGAAVNSVTVAGISEATRIEYIAKSDGVPFPLGLASVVWVRAVEAIGLGLLLIAGAFFLALPPGLRDVELLLGVGLVVLLGLMCRWCWPGEMRWLPKPMRSVMRTLSQIGSPRRLAWPTFFAVVNWVTQWATYHITLLAVGLPIPYAASFAALLMTNVGGIVRVTPANVGVTQGMMAVALLPFGVAVEDAVVAGLVLQAIQVLPVLVLGLGLAARAGLVQFRGGKVRAVTTLPAGATGGASVPGSVADLAAASSAEPPPEVGERDEPPRPARSGTGS